MAKKYLVVKVDTNDADYIEGHFQISNEEIEKLKPLLKTIGESEEDCNYPYGNCVRDESGKDLYSPIVGEEVCDFFEDNFLPWSENGFHTIESIKVLEVVSEIDLLTGSEVNEVDEELLYRQVCSLAKSHAADTSVAEVYWSRHPDEVRLIELCTDMPDRPGERVEPVNFSPMPGEGLNITMSFVMIHPDDFDSTILPDGWDKENAICVFDRAGGD